MIDTIRLATHSYYARDGTTHDRTHMVLGHQTNQTTPRAQLHSFEAWHPAKEATTNAGIKHRDLAPGYGSLCCAYPH